MRVPEMVSDFFDWRWAPCVGLTAGSLAFVVLAVLLIPTRFDGEPRAAATLSSFPNPRPQRALYASSLAASLAETEHAPDDSRMARPAPQSNPQAIQTGASFQRGFSPILDRPPAPPPAAPAPPPAPAPAPAPAAPVIAPAVEPLATAPSSVVVPQPVPGGESREVPAQ